MSSWIITVIVAVTGIVGLAVLAAYISVLWDTVKHYKALANRWEELYFEALSQGTPIDGMAEVEYWGGLKKSEK